MRLNDLKGKYFKGLKSKKLFLCFSFFRHSHCYLPLMFPKFFNPVNQQFVAFNSFFSETLIVTTGSGFGLNF